MQPFLRWAGSKRLLLPKLRPYVPASLGRYIEPFAGSACFFFDLEPQDAILGDLNTELVCALREVQRDPYLVLQCIRRLPTGEKSYYAVRAKDHRSLAPAEVAARFIYLNHYCFNGLFRTDRAGRFNVPYGPPKSGASIAEEAVIRASRLLRNARLLEGDFENTLAHARAGDFVYLDPPFAISGRRVFRQYGPTSFATTDLPRLAAALHRLNDGNVRFVASYADSHEAREWLGEWSPKRVRTRRNIAGFAGNRRGSYELVVTNGE